MEIKENQYDLSSPYSVSSYVNSLLQHVNNSALSDNVFKTSKNHIVVISENGYFKKISSSFLNSFGYSEVELFSMPANKIVIGNKFVLENNCNNYYFENSISDKKNSNVRIKWRLIPYVNEGSYVFLGWEIKRNSMY